MKPYWSGVFPAITTQLHKDGSLDLDGTATHAEVLIKSGIKGLIFLGSLGENQPMSGEEKRRVMEAMVKVVNGRVAVLSGVAETSTAEAVRYVRDMEKLGADGVMLMPAMLYKGDTDETLAHFRTVAKSTGLPIMIYNNPISYANDITPELFAKLADQKNFVALKESSGDVRRITDLHNTVGDRYAIFTGDVVADLPIADRQTELDQIINAFRMGAYKPRAVAYSSTPYKEEVDQPILNRIGVASNSAAIKLLWEGKFKDTHPSQSEADMALLSHLCFYSSDDAEVARLFRMSVLGQRRKAPGLRARAPLAQLSQHGTDLSRIRV